jgi:hypothetical protein
MAPRDFTKEPANTPSYVGHDHASPDRRRTQTSDLNTPIAAAEEASIWVDIRKQAKHIDKLMVGRKEASPESQFIPLLNPP